MAGKKGNKQKKSVPTNVPIFKEGDLVGAKVKGHALWPSRIERVEVSNGKKIYTVRFFATDQTGSSFVELKHFKDFTPQERKCNRRGFQEALELCQKEFDSQNASHDHTQSDHDDEDYKLTLAKNVSPCSSPATNSLTIVEDAEAETKPEPLPVETKRRAQKRVNPKLDTPIQKKIKIEKASKLVDNAKQAHDVVPKCETTNGTHHNELNIVNSEHPRLNNGKLENAIKVSPQRARAIAKLKEKQAAKDAEKKRRKEEFKKERALQKATDVYPKVIENLMKFSRISQSLSKVNSMNQLKPGSWETAVRIFTNNTLSILAKCIKSDHNNQSTERRRCHDALVKVVEALNTALENEKLPPSVMDGVKKSRKQIKKTKEVSNFIKTEIGGQKKAMIERRENDA